MPGSGTKFNYLQTHPSSPLRQIHFRLWRNTLDVVNEVFSNQQPTVDHIYTSPCRELLFEERGYEIVNTHARDGIFLYYTCFFSSGKQKFMLMRRMTMMMVAFVKIMIKITKIMMIDIMMMRLLRTPIDPT